MAKIISIHSFRGGTGKSNVTANLATIIARKGYRVGIVDTDIQTLTFDGANNNLLELNIL